MNQNLKIILFQILTPITIGILLYAFFREIPLLDPLNKTFPLIEKKQNKWIENSLPDGLWLYSLNASFLLIWKPIEKLNLIIWTSIAFLLSISFEFLQYYEFIDGTFDIIDLFFYTISLISFIVINKLHF